MTADKKAVEAAHKALMSELFLICQPNHGDVFAFMDDHPEIIAVAYPELVASISRLQAELDEARSKLGGKIADLRVTNQDLELWQLQAETLKATLEATRATLKQMTEHYVMLAASGDCGFWNPEEEPQVIAARAALNREPKT